VVQDFRGTSTRLLDSPFAEWLPKSSFGKALRAGGELDKVRAAAKAIATQLDMTAEEVRDDVFGDAVAFAYLPPRNGVEESAVFLLLPRKPDTLAKLIRNVNDAQTKRGELRSVREVTHRGRVYFERDKGNEKEYYRTCDDGVFAFSGQEAAIKAVIDHEEAKPTGPPKFVTLLDRLGARSAAAVLLFDPRAMDAEFAANAKDSKDPNEKAFLAQFGKLWAATEAAGVTLTLDTHAELAVNVAFDPTRVPAELKPLLATPGGSTALWSVIPADALVAVAGRFDVDRLSSVVQSFLSEDGKNGLKATSDGIAPVIGKDTLPKVAKGVGPDWGLWLTAPGNGEKPPMPVATFALRVRPAGSTDDTVGDAIVSGLDFAAQLLRVEYNKNHDDQFTLATEKHDGGSVKVLTNAAALPPGVRPAYGLRGDFLVIASNPEAVKRFTPPAKDAMGSAAPLMRVSAVKLREYLATHRTRLSELVGKWTGEKPADIEKGFADFATVLELFDTMELTHTGDGKTTKLALQVKTAKPLRK
jgi:hypothetical protein